MYEKNRDLILLCFFGFIYYSIVVGLNGHMTRVPLAEFFTIPFFIACLMGISISKISQMLEWPICFFFGGLLANLLLMSLMGIMGAPVVFAQLINTFSVTFAWFGTISIMILIGLFIGIFLKFSYQLVLGSLKIHL